MDIEQRTTLVRGWLESVGAADANGALPLVIRQNNQLKTVWLSDDCATSIPTVQSVVAVPVAPDNSARLPAGAIDVVRIAEPLGEDLSGNCLDLAARHIRIRSPLLRAAAQFRHFIQKYAREYLESLGCINVHTPILVEATCVCSGDVFTFPYYGKRIATLVQSPWMYVDVMTTGVERAYALNPSFRRERTATNIHLVEIWQLQVDMTWMSNEEIMSVEESLVRELAHRLKTQHADLYELGQLNPSHLDALQRPFARITYDESLELLRRQGVHLEYGSDYSQKNSDLLSAQFDRPYFITDFPKRLKNFWFPSRGGDPDLTPSNDLFAHTGHGELIGGGERVTDCEELIRNLAYYKHDLDEFAWFVDTRRHGCAPHAGFSVGFDRLTAFLMGVSDIRLATLFPRIPLGPITP
jgi:asparaginyl-tRNA synthetase